MAEYVHPEVLVSTEWVAAHANDPNVRIVESDEDVLLYEVGHIPGAVKVDWHNELQHQVVRDYVDKDAFARLVGGKGIGNNHTIVFYGDRNNWWACYAMWVFKMYGHNDCRIMNGGRQKWIDEGRALTQDRPSYPAVTYAASGPDLSIRAFRQEVMDHIQAKKPLIDVRSPGEYSGEMLHMPDYPQEGALRGGHIPGAASVPWAQAVAPDGTFKSVDELKALYEGRAGLKSQDDVVVYCRIGERSSHTWFVLTYLLGYAHVRNYDGSWTEWGNLVGAPIEKSV
ncbi:MAG: sulfurtransferase [Candidatus Tectomicrobia bacterium]|uniref:Sulfurtransferase n=1 Tax=Tectimicrobiota bacterium TaxID=2528274 RepID=A0A938B273_UNCTE|nr:sulfurtransferase [Candidatus Tectomicrobia bacterium]